MCRHILIPTLADIRQMYLIVIDGESLPLYLTIDGCWLLPDLIQKGRLNRNVHLVPREASYTCLARLTCRRLVVLRNNQYCWWVLLPLKGLAQKHCKSTGGAHFRSGGSFTHHPKGNIKNHSVLRNIRDGVSLDTAIGRPKLNRQYLSRHATTIWGD